MLNVYSIRVARGTAEETMQMMQVLNTLERFHRYDLSEKELQMNDTFADVHSPIFDLIINNPN
jgi:hypothetical protein